MLTDLDERHAAARAGDAGAVNDLVTHFRKMALSRAARAADRHGLDPDDAESHAMEAVWVAVLGSDAVRAVPAYHLSAFRYRVLDMLKERSKRPSAANGLDWSFVPAGVAFPQRRPHTDVAPCLACGTKGGHQPSNMNKPARQKGLCMRCFQREYRAARAAS